MLYSADANFNIYTTSYTDGACTTSTGAADARMITTPCTANPVGSAGVFGPTATMSYVYSTTQPDAVFNVQSSGYLVTNATYASTMCTGIPKYAIYLNIRTCLPLGSTPIKNTQFFADTR